MSADPGIWGWTADIGRLGFTVTMSLGRTPDEVLALYGADPGRLEHLTRDQAWVRHPPSRGGLQLRAGMLGRWAFCFEEAESEGMRTSVLRRLSADTETIGLTVSLAGSSFVHIKDGEGVEAFRPGIPESLRGGPPNPFWAATEKVTERLGRSAPASPEAAVLQAIAKHVRAALDRATLEGPLLTGFLSDAALGRTPPVDDVPTPAGGLPRLAGPVPGAAAGQPGAAPNPPPAWPPADPARPGAPGPAWSPVPPPGGPAAPASHPAVPPGYAVPHAGGPRPWTGRPTERGRSLAGGRATAPGPEGSPSELGGPVTSPTGLPVAAPRGARPARSWTLGA